MIWVSKQGAVGPIGSKRATASSAGGLDFESTGYSVTT